MTFCGVECLYIIQSVISLILFHMTFTYSNEKPLTSTTIQERQTRKYLQLQVYTNVTPIKHIKSREERQHSK